MKKNKTILKFVLVMLLCLSLSGCASCDRGWKTIGSDLGGGLYRTVKVYDYNGNLLAEYEGKIDIEEAESKVFFDINGKRIIIYNAIVITEEK